MAKGAAGGVMRDEAALWAAFAAPLRAFVRKRLPPALDPEDVLQEIFLRIARQGELLDDIERVDAWIYRIARTALADALRAHARREARVEDVDTDALPDPEGEESTAVVAELTPCLTPFVQRLAEPYRSALELTALGGLSQQEAATRAGISFSGMKSRVQRAREQVREQLLRCCTVQLDVRGAVMDYEVRDRTVCGPRDAAGGDAADVDGARGGAGCAGDGCAPSA